MEETNIIEEMNGVIAESLLGGKGADSKTIAFEVLELAIRIEKLTKEHYAHMAKHVTDKSGKSMFEYLASEEAEHLKALKTQYDALKSGTPFAVEGIEPLHKTCPVVSPEKMDIEESSDVLPEESDAKKNTSDLEALKVAIEVKKREIKFYCNAAEKLADDYGKGVFAKLVEIEERHLKELEVQYAFLDQAGFWFDHNMVTD